MATKSIDYILINDRPHGCKLLFRYSGSGTWSRYVTTIEHFDDTVEESTSISTCSAEDIIVELLFDMGKEGILISVGKGHSTPIFTQGGWVPPADLYSDGKTNVNVLAMLVGKEDLKIG